MTDHAENPLAAARHLLAELRAQPAEPAVQQALTKLDSLLEQAVAGASATSTPDTKPKPSEVSATDTNVQLAEQSTKHVEFVSTLVHELRKPMTSIRGYADMLAKPNMVGTLNPMQQNFADTIRNNIVRMDWLLSDLSDINKLSANRLRLERKMISVDSLREEIEVAVSGLVAEHEHTLTINITPELPALNADPKQLVKVIVLLLRNAVFYTPKGTGQIVLTAASTSTAGEVRVSVKDNGIGMRAEDIARLGELFFRADHELVTNTKGYGLGIPVVKGFLALMESSLEIESVPDGGSTFSFTLRGI